MSQITADSTIIVANKSNNGPSFIGGVYLPPLSTDAVASLQKSLNDGFDYVVTDLPVLGTSNPVAGKARSDVTRLESKWWSTSVVGLVGDPPHWKQSASARESSALKTYPGVALLQALTSTGTSPRATARRKEAHAVLMGMMEWASHMNIPAVILPHVPLTEFNDGDAEDDSDDDDMFAVHPTNTKSACTDRPSTPPTIHINNRSAKEYARLLTTLATSPICTTSHVQLWIRVPLTLQHLRSFQLLLARCDHAPSIGCMLYVDSLLDAKDVPDTVRELHLFLGGGNVKAVSWDVSIFLKNKRGYPALSKSHQFVFQMLFGRLGRTLRLLVEGMVGEAGVNVPSPSKTLAQPIGQHGGGSSGRLHHLQYLRHLRSRPQLTKVLDSEEAIIETPYLDHLQSPLQPLGDHLEYQTYETFEKDPVKYKRYGEAIEFALEDGIEEGRFDYLGSTTTTSAQLKKIVRTAQGDDDDELFDDVDVDFGYDGEIVNVDIHRVTILVVGAGRGPLVKEAIDAVSRVSASWISKTSDRPEKRRQALYAKIIAVEKNPSAVLYLQSLRSSDTSWTGGQDYIPESDSMETNDKEGDIIIPGTSNVNIVGCDMRQAADSVLKYMVHNPNLRADLVVSELLGSFGDNELSPECLDGVQRCGILKENCVSIPQSYTSFLAPVSSTRLHNEAKSQSCHPLNPNEGPSGPSIGIQRALETPYVVRSHAASQTHSEQACWTFCHPHPPLKQRQVQTKSTTSMDTDVIDRTNLSAEAAKSINNDRCAHLSFQHDATRGVANGCGYGACDPEMTTVASTNPDETSSAPKTDTTTLVLHGFLGTFHSVLYESKDRKRSSVISIAPSTFSVGMFSWFPLYFPLREPLRVPPGAHVNCSIWRRSDRERVWYEWCAEVATSEGSEEVVMSTGCVHNPGGRSYHVRL
ncbi:hypothetical protein HJC23_013258 [Cyclotella cryptica]|uniref:Protein arginine N-methyltransferase n=1 Tax=Cyclotella cryptica TaxID=29204 RepID=A0ABD3PFN4_9STRA|eukprot:CCRYP_014921-RA/>CCRYP_014921-RA protein AED:0.02 eAED:0.02 QI:183/1/1/1/1/1/2/134/920